jgi:hypothetical protein
VPLVPPLAVLLEVEPPLDDPPVLVLELPPVAEPPEEAG